MIVVDTSALICLLYEEPQADAFTSIMARASALTLSAANYFETSIVIDANRDEELSERLDELIVLSGIQIAPVTRDHAVIARRAYRMYGKGHHPAKLNYGDCFAYALAKVEDAPLLFKGNDFALTDVVPAF